MSRKSRNDCHLQRINPPSWPCPLLILVANGRGAVSSLTSNMANNLLLRDKSLVVINPCLHSVFTSVGFAGYGKPVSGSAVYGKSVTGAGNSGMR